MVIDSGARESVQILLLVCLPLTLLLVTLIIIRIRSSRTTTKFPTFSVSLTSLGREQEYIYYCEKGTRLEFILQPSQKRLALLTWPLPKKEAVLSAPEKLTEEDIERIVPNLVRGLAKFGFKEYRLFRGGRILAHGKVVDT